MTTLMRNGRDRRSENPSGPTRYLSACFWLGPISGSHQGQQPLRLHRDRGSPPSENRPYTWLHPNASQKVKLLLHRGRRPYMAHNCFDSERSARPLLGVKQPRPWLDRAAVIDPKRYFTTANCRIAKGSFDHFVGAQEDRQRDVRCRGKSGSVLLCAVAHHSFHHGRDLDSVRRWTIVGAGAFSAKGVQSS